MTITIPTGFITFYAAFIIFWAGFVCGMILAGYLLGLENER